MVTDRSRSTTALWLFVGVVLFLPVLYWIVFHYAGQVGIEVPRGVFGVLRSYGPTNLQVIKENLTSVPLQNIREVGLRPGS